MNNTEKEGGAEDGLINDGISYLLGVNKAGARERNCEYPVRGPTY